jgi:hypothetical protein
MARRAEAVAALKALGIAPPESPADFTKNGDA